MLEANSRPLGVLNNTALTPEQIERLCIIEEFDLWFVIERVEQKGAIAPPRIAAAVKEFRKYMALIALGHTELGMASPDVDEIWHNFILFTQEYGEFCEKVCGRIIHHRPNTSRRPQLPDGSVADFVSAYTKFFGEPPSIWPVQKRSSPGAALLDGDCDVGGPACNGSTDCDSAPHPAWPGMTLLTA